MAISIGTKVEYRRGDKWLTGVVHGIKKAEAVKGPEIILGYLVDTGKDERVDEYKYNPRDMEIGNRIQVAFGEQGITAMDNPDEALKIIDTISKAKDLPKSEIKMAKVRQPQQVEVLPDDIRAVK